MFAAALAAGAYADEFVSPGNGTVYTLEDLSKIEACGVHKVDGAWVLDSHSPSPMATCFVCKTTKW